jgi:hypothetical protein
MTCLLGCGSVRGFSFPYITHVARGRSLDF